MPTSHDVVIVGAGPAGCSTGEQLARRGFDIAVLEEHGAVGEPVDCTGVLSAEAFERLPFPNFSGQPVGDAAGQVKSTSDGGIYFEMLSGHIAAETAADAFRKGRFGSDMLALYETRWRASLGLDLRLGSLFRRLLSRMADRDVDELFQMLQREIAAGRAHWDGVV